MNLRLIATATALLALVACSNSSGPDAQVSESSSPSTTGSTSPSASTTSATTMRVPVYYLGGTAARPVLYREFRSVPRTDAIARAAVDAMLHLTPLDTDYRTYWPTTTTVLGVSVSGTTATVDLSSEAGTVTTSTANEKQSLQQLVYTVTAAAPSITAVRLHLDGETKPTQWGHVSTSGAVGRAPQVDTLAAVWVIDPAHHATVGRTFTVTGTASVFEATVSWEVTCPCSTPVKGFVTATEGGPGRGDYTGRGRSSRCR